MQKIINKFNQHRKNKEEQTNNEQHNVTRRKSLDILGEASCSEKPIDATEEEDDTQNLDLIEYSCEKCHYKTDDTVKLELHHYKKHLK